MPDNLYREQHEENMLCKYSNTKRKENIKKDIA